MSVSDHFDPHGPVTRSERPSILSAASDTQRELAELQSGARWSLTATERAYNAGGNEPGTVTEGSPQQERH